MYFNKAFKGAIHVILLCALLACSGKPVLNDNENCLAINQSKAIDKSRRPFYLIGHNPDTPADALRQLRMGFNALGPDLRFVDGEIRVDNQFMIGNFSVQWPRHLGVGPTLENYLITLRIELARSSIPAPALIVWDLKPPFSVTWMREAILVTRNEFTRHYPNTAVAFTVGEIEGADEIAKLAPYLQKGEAIGIDDYYSAEQSFETFGRLGKPYVYANRDRAWSIDEALKLRKEKQAFPFLFAWTVNSPEQIRGYILQGIDGIIVDEHAIKNVCKLLEETTVKSKIRLATGEDKPFH
jgi:hypothetical protein